MDHRRRMTCCWTMAVCILWIVTAEGQTYRPSMPTPGAAESVDSSPTPSADIHSLAGTITGTIKVEDIGPTMPAYTTTGSASIIITSAAFVKNYKRYYNSPPPGNVAPSGRPLVPPLPIGKTLRPAAARPATPSATPKTTRSPYTPPMTPPTRPTRTESTPLPVLVEKEPAGEKEPGESAEPNTELKMAAVPLPLCDYDPCVHLQRPCPGLKELKGWNCRCPALTTDPSTTPGPVVALEVTRVGPTAAGVRWCAPDAALSAFLVWVLRHDGSVVSNSSVSPQARQTDVFGLSAGHSYSVCVSARGVAGVSHKRCAAVSTPRDAEAIALYVLSGGCGVLLLTAVALSLCLHRQCNTRRRTSGAPSLLNPNAQSFHDTRLTSMVSLSNPAYSADEQQASSSGNAHFNHQARKQPA